MPCALLDCFEALDIDLGRDILTSYDRIPLGGPTEPLKGAWLTHRQLWLSI